jgi:hypothetical protein
MWNQDANGRGDNAVIQKECDAVTPATSQLCGKRRADPYDTVPDAVAAMPLAP